MSTHSSTPAQRKAHNDRMMAKHHDWLVNELKTGEMGIRAMSRKIRVDEHRIYQLADAIGVDMKERNRRVRKAQAQRVRDEKINAICKDLRGNKKAQQLNISAMAKHYGVSTYIIYDVLKQGGFKSGMLSEIKHDPIDAGMAGALSREWLGKLWRTAV